MDDSIWFQIYYIECSILYYVYLFITVDFLTMKYTLSYVNIATTPLLSVVFVQYFFCHLLVTYLLLYLKWISYIWLIVGPFFKISSHYFFKYFLLYYTHLKTVLVLSPRMMKNLFYFFFPVVQVRCFPWICLPVFSLFLSFMLLSPSVNFHTC